MFRLYFLRLTTATLILLLQALVFRTQLVTSPIELAAAGNYSLLCSPKSSAAAPELAHLNSRFGFSYSIPRRGCGLLCKARACSLTNLAVPVPCWVHLKLQLPHFDLWEVTWNYFGLLPYVLGLHFDYSNDFLSKFLVLRRSICTNMIWSSGTKRDLSI